MMSEQIVISCRHCGQSNRISMERAIADMSRPICGKCDGHLFTPLDGPLENLTPERFEHPLDRNTLAALKAVPGIERLTKLFIKERFERAEILRHYASFVRVSEKQVKDVYHAYEKAAKRLGMSELPELFIIQFPVANAYTLGATTPLIAVSSGLIDLLEEDELIGVLAHELTHVLCHHVLFKTAAHVLATAGLALAASTFGLSNIVFIPLRLALLEWDRCSELTADRGELLATGSLDCHVRTMMKLAGGSAKIYQQMSADAFLEQVSEVEKLQDESWLNRVTALQQELGRTHPFPVWRAHHTMKWAKSQQFFETMAGLPIDGATKAAAGDAKGSAGEPPDSKDHPKANDPTIKVKEKLRKSDGSISVDAAKDLLDND